jgi:hypothetical protein
MSITDSMELADKLKQNSLSWRFIVIAVILSHSSNIWSIVRGPDFLWHVTVFQDLIPVWRTSNEFLMSMFMMQCDKHFLWGLMSVDVFVRARRTFYSYKAEEVASRKFQKKYIRRNRG